MQRRYVERVTQERLHQRVFRVRASSMPTLRAAPFKADKEVGRIAEVLAKLDAEALDAAVPTAGAPAADGSDGTSSDGIDGRDGGATLGS
jgi:hypothetical protein